MVDGISFGKKRNLNFEGFNGIKKEDFNVENNSKKQKLVEAFFNKYNKDGAQGDNVLDINELSNIYDDVNKYASGGKKGNLGKREATKFLENLGFKKGEYSREDLLEILNEINKDEDSVDFAGTDNDGNTMIQYKPDKNNINRTEVYNSKHLLAYDTVENDEMAIITQYADDGKKKTAEIAHNKANGSTLNTRFGTDGTTVEERFRQVSPAIREDLDPANGNRVIKRTTDMGNNLVKTQEYEYGTDSVTELLTNPDGTKVKTSISDGGMKYVSNFDAQNNELKREAYSGENKVWTSEYTYDENGVTENTTHYSVDDSTKITGRTRKTSDNDGNTLTYVNVDENGNTQDYEHTVDPQTDTWYGIVQAKYAVTDHKTTMAIVHQLKANHNVARSAKTIPNKITLPATVKVGNKDYGLINITQSVNDVHNIPSQIAIPADIPADKLPQKIAPLTAAQKKVTIPPLSVTKPANIAQADLPQNGAAFPEGMPKKIDITQYQLPIVKENAGKLVEQENGLFFQYDPAGKVKYVYANKVAADNNRDLLSIDYNNVGIEKIFIKNYDDVGHDLDGIQYDAKGNANAYSIATKLADNKYQRVSYDINGNVKNFRIHEYNSDNQNTKTTKYNPEGQATGVFEMTYNDNILSKETTYEYINNEIHVRSYNSSEDIRLGNNSTRIDYNNNGKPIQYRIIGYDETGNYTENLKYGANGNFEEHLIYSNFDEQGMDTREVCYNANGEVTHFFDNSEYRDDGELVRYNRFTPQGKYDAHFEYKYNPPMVYSFVYDNKGRLIK